MSNNELKTLDNFDVATEISRLSDYDYQAELTPKLDELDTPFTQEVINEIVLWKVNRYAKVDSNTLKRLSCLELSKDELNEEITRTILLELMSVKGVALPMASTILRFRNPNVYQIIDKRVYRIIYGKKLTLSSIIDKNIALYLQYLHDLKDVCQQYDIEFSESDRVLYQLDKLENKDIPLDKNLD